MTKTLFDFIQTPANSIHVSNIQVFKSKINSLVRDKLSSVHVITDFDMTLTKYWVNGKRSPSTHHVIMDYSGIRGNYKERSMQLYQKYYPMEISTSLSLEEKKKAMCEWWTSAHDMIIEQKFKKMDLVKMVSENGVFFRQGIQEFTSLCDKKQVPLLIFSAGIADVIEELLKKDSLLYPNAHIISNKLGFNENGECDHFEGDLIHVFNKNESNVTDPNYKVLIQHRKNVILMGDSLGDLHMAEGITHDIKLTIGYLNHDQQNLLQKYSEAFDVVILNDSPLDFINLLLNELE